MKMYAGSSISCFEPKDLRMRPNGLRDMSGSAQDDEAGVLASNFFLQTSPSHRVLQ